MSCATKCAQFNHTSGITPYLGNDSGVERSRSLEERIRQKNNARLWCAPGTRFKYASLNYDILGLIIEKVTGQPYEAYMRTHVFEPLAMTHTDAFQLVSDFDKQTLTEADFAAWRTSTEGVVDKKSFIIIRMADRFKNYEYMGTRFNDAYGFEVGWEQESLVPDAQKTDYDEDNFLIMMAENIP